MLITIIFGWCRSGSNEKISKQLELSDKDINDLTLDHSSPYKILNDTDPIKYPELCICNSSNKDNKEIEYFGLKVFDGDDELEDNICLRPEDYSELSRNLFCLLAENNWIVSYTNGKPMIYIICTSVQNSKL